jgi:hypothetical protein
MQAVPLFLFALLTALSGYAPPVSASPQQSQLQQRQLQQRQLQRSRVLQSQVLQSQVLQSQVLQSRILQSRELTPPQKAVALEFLQTVTYSTPEAARKALKIDPNDAEAHRTLADFDGEHSDQFQNEIKERREAVRCYPNNPYDIINLGLVLSRVDKPEAVRLLSQVANGNFSSSAKKQASDILTAVQAQKQ